MKVAKSAPQPWWENIKMQEAIGAPSQVSCNNGTVTGIDGRASSSFALTAEALPKPPADNARSSLPPKSRSSSNFRRKRTPVAPVKVEAAPAPSSDSIEHVGSADKDGPSLEDLREAEELVRELHDAPTTLRGSVPDSPEDRDDHYDSRRRTRHHALLGAVPLLTLQEETELSQRVQRGLSCDADGNLEYTPEAKEARDHMILANLRLVACIAKKYGKEEDLLQVGVIGLGRAVDRFDPTIAKFSTYAAWWINQALKRYLSYTSREIRLPVHAGQIYARLVKVANTLRDGQSKPPTDRDVFNAYNRSQTPRDLLSWERFCEIWRSPLTTSGDALLTDELGSATVFSTIPDPDAVVPGDALAEHTRANLAWELLDHSGLTERHRKILTLRYPKGVDEIPRTLEEIGKIFGITRERIRQLEAAALNKLRERMMLHEKIPGEKL
jgi:RNA polymerase primary sigma factor